MKILSKIKTTVTFKKRKKLIKSQKKKRNNLKWTYLLKVFGSPLFQPSLAVDMIWCTVIKLGQGGRLAPKLVDTGGKQRTISCCIIRERRLTFLHYILNQETNSMIYKFFETKWPKRNWVGKPKFWLHKNDVKVKF